MGWQKKKKQKSPPFVMIYRDMLSSEAWKYIGNASKVAYIHLKSKIVSKDQKIIYLSFKEMEKHMTHHTFSKAIEELISTGFITKEQFGGLYRRRNSYQLSEDWNKFRGQVQKLHRHKGKNYTVGSITE